VFIGHLQRPSHRGGSTLLVAAGIGEWDCGFLSAKRCAVVGVVGTVSWFPGAVARRRPDPTKSAETNSFVRIARCRSVPFEPLWVL
jgi:hypothetical protein